MQKVMNIEQYLNLKQGEKYTIWGFSEFGFPYCIQCKLVDVKCRPYAQYKESIWLHYLSKGARKVREMIILPNNTVMIWPGWITVNDEMWGKSEERKGLIVREAKGRCFDPIYITDALKSVDSIPLIKQC